MDMWFSLSKGLQSDVTLGFPCLQPFSDRAELPDRRQVMFAPDGLLGGNCCIKVQNSEFAVGQLEEHKMAQNSLIIPNACNFAEAIELSPVRLQVQILQPATQFI